MLMLRPASNTKTYGTQNYLSTKRKEKIKTLTDVALNIQFQLPVPLLHFVRLLSVEAVSVDHYFHDPVYHNHHHPMRILHHFLQGQDCGHQIHKMLPELL